MLNQDEEEDLSGGAAAATAGRRSSQRSLSTDSQNAGCSISTQTPRVTYTTASSTAPGSSPVKITISKSMQGRPVGVQSSSQPPKVILVTSAGPAPTVVQRSMSAVPVVRNQPSPLSSAYPGFPMPPYSGHGPVSAPRSSVLVPGAGQVPALSVSAGHQVVSAYPGVVTTASGTSVVSTTVTMPTSSMGGNPALFNPSLQGLGKIRPRIVPRQRYPAMVSPPPQPQLQKPGAVLPMGPQLTSPLPQAVSMGAHPLATSVSVAGSSGQGSIVGHPPHQYHMGGSGVPSQSPHHHQHHHHQGPQQFSSAGIQVNQPSPMSAAVAASAGGSGGPAMHVHGPHGAHGAGVQVKTLSKPTIQIKQEGGMKIITQGGSSKILPKPSQLSGSGGPPVVMVNTGQGGHQGSTTGITMLPRSISTYTAHSGGKVLNITTPGGRVIATTTKATNVVTVNPKTLHLTAVKSGSVSKPNVIVVQKTQHARFQSPLGGNIRTVTTSTLPGAIDKELMGLVHHKDSHGRHVLTASNPAAVSTPSVVGARPGERRVIITTSGGGGEPVSIIHRGRADSEGKTSSLLAELIQAAGIMPSDASVETVAQGTDPYDFDNPEGEQRLPSQHQVVTTPSGQVVFRQAQPSSVGGVAAGPFHTRIQQQQQHPHSQQQQQHSDADWNPGSIHEDKGSSQDSDSGTEQVFTLEQAMSLLNKEVVDLTEAEQPTTSSSSSSSSSLLPPVVVSAAPPSIVSAAAPSTLHQFHHQVSAATGGGALSAGSIIAGSSSILPNILNNSTLAPQGQPQPKVSILAKSKLLSGVVKDPSGPAVTSLTPLTPGLDPAGVGGLAAAVPSEEGLKEGQLDTQTGLFYQVNASPATIRVSAPQQHPPPPLHSPASSVVRVAVTTTVTTAAAATKPTTSSLTSLTATGLSQSHNLRHHATPAGVIPASVTTTSPLTVISAKLPPSTMLSSSLSSLSSLSSSSSSSSVSASTYSIPQPPHPSLSSSLSSSSAAAAKGAAAAARAVVASSSRGSPFLPPPPPLDLLSSSLAQAEINFQDQDDDDEEEDEGEVGSIHPVGDNDHTDGKTQQQQQQQKAGTSFADAREQIEDNYEEGLDFDDEKDHASGVRSDNDLGVSASPVLEKERAGGVSPGPGMFLPPPAVSANLGETCRPGMAEVLREETAKDGTVILTVSNPASSQPEPSSSQPGSASSTFPPIPSSPSSSSSSSLQGPTLVTLPSQLSRVSPSVPTVVSPNQHLGQLYSVLDSQQPTHTAPNQTPNPSVANSKTVLLTQTSSTLPPTASVKAASIRPATSPSSGQKAVVPQTGVLPIAVSVEPSGSVIAFNLDNLNGQQVIVPQGEAETNTDFLQEDVGSAGSDHDSQGEGLLVRSSKRKRKHNSGYEEPSTPPNSWAKSAAGLLLKVARFKGSARDKSEIPAAEWFTYPVDPMDAPDYYTVVQTPMDFSTMRKKLETGHYNSFEEFQSDMELIRSNCYLYNSEGTKVRRDCDEVMAFYTAELLKVQGKQTFSQYSSPSPMKKPKEDKSPQKQ